MAPKNKASGQPKRPLTGYFMWLNDNRDRIKKENPGASVTEIAKKAGEYWRSISANEKAEYEKKVAKAKEEYKKAMEAFEESGGTTEKKSKGKKAKKSESEDDDDDEEEDSKSKKRARRT